MFRSHTVLRAWLALIALAVMAMPVSGAHLHLCFDGAEAPATYHATEDGSTHGDPTVDRSHHDKDVSLQGAALSKKLDRAVDIPGFFAATYLVVRLPVPAPALVPLDDLPVPVSIGTARLLPPLRAPPV